MKQFLNRIYYSLLIIEDYLYPYGNRGGYSGGFIIGILTFAELSVTSTLSGVFCLILIHKMFDYAIVIPIVTTLIFLYVIDHYVRTNIWKEPNREQLSVFDTKDHNVIGWFAIAVFTWIVSFMLAIAGLFFLFWSFGRVGLN